MSYQSTTDLNTPIEYLKGVGPVKSEVLKKELGVKTFGDLLQHYPFRYVDKTKITYISDINENSQYIQIRGQLTSMSLVGSGRGQRLTAKIADQTGEVELVWFKGISYFQKFLVKRKEYLVFSKPTFFRGKPNFTHPDIEEIVDPNIPLSSRLMPIYHSTEKLKAKKLDTRGLARIIQNLIERLTPDSIPDFLTPEFVEDQQLMSRYEAFRNVHAPSSEEHITSARYRLKFEEFFCFQMRLLQVRQVRKKLEGIVLETLGDKFHNFFKNNLGFELTGAQKRVLKEIRRDTITGSQMNRLLQGDVGSGKTVVALMTMLMALDNGYQTCLMAPTEILAQQHFKSISKMVRGLDITVELLTGSIKGKKRRSLLDYLEIGVIDILIGTHALIEDSVKYKNLGMAVIDEQHRFGVQQRAKLWLKSKIPPHVLVMTATPIPRTLAMTLYGDLDVSQIDELPPGRKAIKTLHRYDKDRLAVFGFLRDQIDKGRQVYIVYPLIEESETFDYKNLMDGFDSITRAFPMPKYHVSIVHGQMHTVDKDFEMERFVEGKTQILVATTVIEVGVDVPNASLMIIESAERFGLSQLHQLRGRVGRGSQQSYCVLMTGHKMTKPGRERIETMVATTDGFKIAEVDMRLRGPGDIQGLQQSGFAGLRMGNVVEDQQILQRARSAATLLLDEDPELERDEHQALKAFLKSQAEQQKLEWSRIS